MRHELAHPLPVEGCFGCKVLGVGIDGKHLTQVKPVIGEDTGRVVGRTRDHRDGRRDAIATPESLVVSRKRRIE